MKKTMPGEAPHAPSDQGAASSGDTTIELRRIVRAHLAQLAVLPEQDMAIQAVGAVLAVEAMSDRMKLLPKFAAKHLRHSASGKLALAAQLKAQAPGDERLGAFATYLEMQAHRQRSAHGAVYKLYVDEAAAQIVERFHNADRTRELLLLAANALLRIGRMDDAKAFVAEQLQLRPGFGGMRELQARMTAIDAPDQALGILKKLIIRGGYDAPSAILLLAELMNRQGDHDAAQALIEAKRATDDNNKDLLLSLVNRAAYRQDWREQHERLGEFFTLQGLWSPAHRVGASHFSLASIAAHALPPVTDGPLVTVVMTAFNAEAFIETAIRSVLNQTYSNLQLIVVDDVSQDGTRAVVERLAATDARIRLLAREANGGTYVAKNAAIATAQGAFITCHDSDDWWHPQHLEKQLDEMVQNPELVATKSGWIRVNEDGFFMLKPWCSYSHQNPASVLFRREVVDDLGYFDSVRTGADTEYWHRMVAAYGAHRVMYMPRTLAIGLHHNSSLTTSGAAGFDDYGVNLTRQSYCEAWARWHTEQADAGQRMRLDFPLMERPFPAPPEIVVLA